MSTKRLSKIIKKCLGCGIEIIVANGPHFTFCSSLCRSRYHARNQYRTKHPKFVATGTLKECINCDATFKAYGRKIRCDECVVINRLLNARIGMARRSKPRLKSFRRKGENPKERLNLTDLYIRRLLRQSSGGGNIEIPQELIEAKRQQIILFRTMKGRRYGTQNNE